jgi:putative oxidoreductase
MRLPRVPVRTATRHAAGRVGDALVQRYPHDSGRPVDACDLGLLGLRATLGPYLVGHGAQKLFGAFGGGGPAGTGEHFEAIGLAPGKAMGVLAGTAELTGGALTALGAVWPLGPVVSACTMAVAAGTAHHGKGAFAMTGGPELPLTDLAAAALLAAAGPGRISVDRFAPTRLPQRVTQLTLLGGVALATALVVRSAIARRNAAVRAGRREPLERPDAEQDLSQTG